MASVRSARLVRRRHELDIHTVATLTPLRQNHRLTDHPARKAAMKVIIIGAGIGGLVCAIACRREGLSVTVLERTAALAPVSPLNPTD
jgi:NADPH-dependent 2,4-dienoyl-CoA reductase/sulfur reductase-like enzyme